MTTNNHCRIQVLDRNGNVRAEAGGAGQAVLAWEGQYEEGDTIRFLMKAPGFYVIRADGSLDESLVYMTENELTYEIPFGEKKLSYNPCCFTGERHYLTLRPARKDETGGRRNLSENPMDQHGSHGCYPHASANVETRGEAVFAARNAIDGVLANTSHGDWPYESWGINRRPDARLLLEFGRPVDIDQIVLYTRADFPHDSWWRQAVFCFSDGSRETVNMEKSAAPHELWIRKKNITWLSLEDLIKSEDDPSPFPALTQIQVFGTESESTAV